MEAKATLRYIRVAPRKARMVVDLIRGKNAEEAMTVLRFTPRRAARVVEKVLHSAVANAEQKEMGDLDALRIVRAFVDVGPTMKRMRPRAMGRANTIRKRTSHITLVLGEDADGAPTGRRSEGRSPKKERTGARRDAKTKARGGK